MGNVSLINGHIDRDKKLYVVYDAEGVHEPPVFGVFTSMELAKKACDWLVEQFMEESLSIDPKESGIDIDTDLPALRKECEQSLGIQIITSGLDQAELISNIESPYDL